MVSGVFSIPLDVQGTAVQSAPGLSMSSALQLRDFIGGDENSLAQVAAEAVLAPTANDKLANFNPLTFYGPPGVGKSHLARGLARRLKLERKKIKVHIISGADFARSYAEALETDSLPELREKYSSADLFVLEDLHELSGKQPALREITYLFDQLLQRKAKILITSNLEPDKINTLPRALTSRISSGLTVQLHAPSAAARHVILQRVVASLDTDISSSALDALANGLPGSTPELISALLNLDLLQRKNNQPIDDEIVGHFLQQRRENKKPTLKQILTRTAKYFHLKSSELTSSSRRQPMVRARGVATYLSRQLTAKSFEQIGRQFGGRDHTTVMHAYRKTVDLMQNDPEIRLAVERLLCGFEQP